MIYDDKEKKNKKFTQESPGDEAGRAPWLMPDGLSAPSDVTDFDGGNCPFQQQSEIGEHRKVMDMEALIASLRNDLEDNKNETNESKRYQTKTGRRKKKV